MGGVLAAARAARRGGACGATRRSTCRSCASRSRASGARRSSRSRAVSARASRSRARWSGPRSLVIMDEPTAALGVAQSQAVLELAKRVRERGTSVLIISHILPHVLDLADRVVVLRHGRKVADLPGRGADAGPADRADHRLRARAPLVSAAAGGAARGRRRSLARAAAGAAPAGPRVRAQPGAAARRRAAARGHAAGARVRRDARRARRRRHHRHRGPGGRRPARGGSRRRPAPTRRARCSTGTTRTARRRRRAASCAAAACWRPTATPTWTRTSGCWPTRSWPRRGEAAARLEPAAIAWGTGAVEIHVNRRERGPDGHIVARLADGRAARPPGGRAPGAPCRTTAPIATVVGFGCHPVAAGMDVPTHSGDYPAALRLAMRRMVGGECVFLQGAAGNVLPRSSFCADEARGRAHGRAAGGRGGARAGRPPGLAAPPGAADGRLADPDAALPLGGRAGRSRPRSRRPSSA